jgi:hypothetical protein
LEFLGIVLEKCFLFLPLVVDSEIWGGFSDIGSTSERNPKHVLRIFFREESTNAMVG